MSSMLDTAVVLLDVFHVRYSGGVAGCLPC